MNGSTHNTPIDSPSGDARRTRSRPMYLLLTAVTILVGLASRRFAHFLPAVLHKNAGDILWATMVYFLVCLILVKQSTWRNAACAALFSIFIELFKFCHLPVIEIVRATTPGRLVFGYSFSWSNLACYGVGIGIGVMIDVGLTRSTDYTYHSQY